MPVDKPFAGTCPFLLDSDTMRLQGFLVLGDASLTDAPLGIRHQITKEGAIVLGAMRAGHTIRALRQLARRNGVDDRQLDGLLGFLNLIGGIRRHGRTARQRIDATVKQIQALRLGIRYAGLSFRSRSTPAGLLVAVARAVWPVVATAVVVGVELAASGLLPRYVVMNICLSGVATFVISIYLHESGHILTLRAAGNRPHILQRRMHVGVIHAQLPYRIEVLSAIAGPLAGVVAAVSIGCWLVIINHPQAAMAAYFVSLFHVFSLLPWYGDGLSLSDDRRRKRSAS